MMIERIHGLFMIVQLLVCCCLFTFLFVNLFYENTFLEDFERCIVSTRIHGCCLVCIGVYFVNIKQAKKGR